MKLFQRARPLLGTIVEISVWGESEEHSHKAISGAFSEIESAQSLLSIHSAESEVSKLNRLKKGVVVKIHSLTYEILRIAQAMFYVTEGFFDVVRKRHSSDNATMQHIQLLDGLQIVFERELSIDFGGIGKGFAVDKAVTSLEAEGIENGVVSAGGDLRVFGAMKQSIFLRNPSKPLLLHKALELQNQALATSANYYRDEGSGCDLDHGITDPKSGELWRSKQSISVAAPTCAQADALTKVVALRGRAAKAALEQNCAVAFSYDGIESRTL